MFWTVNPWAATGFGHSADIPTEPTAAVPIPVVTPAGASG